MALLDRYWTKSWKGGFWISVRFMPYAWGLTVDLWTSIWSIATSAIGLMLRVGPLSVSVGWVRPQ